MRCPPRQGAAGKRPAYQPLIPENRSGFFRLHHFTVSTGAEFAAPETCESNTIYNFHGGPDDDMLPRKPTEPPRFLDRRRDRRIGPFAADVFPTSTGAGR